MESKAKHGKGDNGAADKLWRTKANLRGGRELPSDGAAFVDAVNKHIDLVRLTELSLRGADERSSKSLLEQLLEMRYGKNSRGSEGGGRPVIIDIPSAVARRALEQEQGS